MTPIAANLISNIKELQMKALKEARPPPIWLLELAEEIVNDESLPLMKRVAYGIWLASGYWFLPERAGAPSAAPHGPCCRHLSFGL